MCHAARAKKTDKPAIRISSDLPSGGVWLVMLRWKPLATGPKKTPARSGR
jgi:hypothetical protein